jgi:hypothetical protein
MDKSNFSLDGLIRVVERSYRPRSDEVIVTVDPATRTIVKGSSARFWRARRYYAVSCAQQRHAGVSRVLPIAALDRESDREIGVYLEFLARCEAGSEERLAGALSTEDSPKEALLAIIRQGFTQAIVGRERAFLDDFDALVDELVEGVAGFVSEQTGLQVELRARLKYEDLLDPIEISKKVVQVRPLGVADPQSLIISASIIPMKAERARAVISYPQRRFLPDRLIEAAQAFISRRIDFNQFFDGLQSEHRDDLRAEINAMLAPYGHTLDYFALDAQCSGVRIERFIQIENFEMKLVPRGSAESVTIRNDLLLTLADASRFRSIAISDASVSDVKGWIKRQIEEALNIHLFKTGYVDYLLRFDPIEEKIREELSRRALAIGYQLDHLLSRPDMSEESWFTLTPRVFDFGELPTRQVGIKVDFQVVVSFSLPRGGTTSDGAARVERMLNRRTNIQGAIAESLRSELEGVLHGEEAHDVFMRFNLPRGTAQPRHPESVSGDGGSDGYGLAWARLPSLSERLGPLIRGSDSLSLEEILQAKVKLHLENHYGADVQGVPVIKHAGSRIGEFVESLVDCRGEIRFVVEPPSGAEAFEFTAVIRVASPHPQGWDEIKKMNFGFSDIKHQCIATLRARLGSTENEGLLAYESPGQQQALEATAAELVTVSIARHFGFVVNLSDLERSKTLRERARSEAELVKIKKAQGMIDILQQRIAHEGSIEAKRLQAELDQVETLVKKWLTLLDDDDEESEEAAREIERRLTALLDNPSKRGVEQELTELLGPKHHGVDPARPTPSRADYQALIASRELHEVKALSNDVDRKGRTDDAEESV